MGKNHATRKRPPMASSGSDSDSGSDSSSSSDSPNPLAVAALDCDSTSEEEEEEEEEKAAATISTESESGSESADSSGNDGLNSGAEEKKRTISESESESEEAETESGSDAAVANEASTDDEEEKAEEEGEKESTEEEGVGVGVDFVSSETTESTSVEESSGTSEGEECDSSSAAEPEPPEKPKHKHRGHRTTITKNPDTSPWSVSEDALLMGMRRSKATWKLIAKILKHSEADCKARWRELAAKPNNSHQTSLSPPDGKTADSMSGCGGEKRTGSGSPPHRTPSDERNRGRDRRSRPINESLTAAANPTISDSIGSSDDGGDDDGASPAKSISTADSEYGDSPSSSSENDAAVAAAAAAAASWEDYRQQREYLYGTVYPQLYPPTTTRELEPDDVFGPEDSYILSRIVDKMQRSRVLELQANFFNATGRMVSLPILEKKFRAALCGGDRELREAKCERLHEWLAEP